jgi:antitoxin component YwqK of YwqJK toxin-antitoxin module
MKRLLLVLLPLLLIVGCSSPEPINYEEVLNYRDGVYYTKDTNKPYSGPVFSLDEKGLNKRESILEDGKMISYREFKWFVRFYRVYSWFENGQRKEELNYKNGKKDGVNTQWYENGKKKSEGTWKDGKEDGLVTNWYENGQKSVEFTFKDGERDGLVTNWYENGQKSVEFTLKDGERDGLVTNWSENGQKSGERTYKNGVIVEPLSIVEYDWCYPSCGSDLQSAFKFSSGGTFSSSTIMFGGMSRWGNWEEIDDNTFRLTSTRISSNSSYDQLPKPQIIKLVSDKRLKVGSNVYIR